MTPIELTRGAITTNESQITAKSGRYNLTANYSKQADNNFNNVSITAAWEQTTARLEQYGDNMQVIYSLPENLTDADKTEIIAILDNVLSQIKTF